MSSEQFWELEVVNFGKHNPANKKLQWFKVVSDLPRSPEYLSLSDRARGAWWWLLGQRATEGRPIIRVTSGVLCPEIRCKPPALPSVLGELTKLGWLRIHNAPPTRVRATNERTNVTRRTNERDETNASQDPSDLSPDTRPNAARNSSAQQSFDLPDGKSGKGKKPKPLISEGEADLRRRCWESYRAAYLKRWKLEPSRNATVNSQIGSLAKRLGEEAPMVLAFYVDHNDSFYVKKCHPVGLCLKDAEGLRTQWARGQQITGSTMKQFEKGQYHREQMERAEQGKL